jgi:hypothetical protein
MKSSMLSVRSGLHAFVAIGIVFSVGSALAESNPPGSGPGETGWDWNLGHHHSLPVPAALVFGAAAVAAAAGAAARRRRRGAQLELSDAKSDRTGGAGE